MSRNMANLKAKLNNFKTPTNGIRVVQGVLYVDNRSSYDIII